MTNRWPEIAGVLIVVALLLGGFYTAGYWCWLRPNRLEISGFKQSVYTLDDTAANRALGVLYEPVVRMSGDFIWFVPEYPGDFDGPVLHRINP